MSVGPAGGIRTVIVGASGRMGGQLLRVLHEFPALRLHGAVIPAPNAAVGQDAGTYAGVAPCGVTLTASLAPLLTQADLVVDFSSAAAAPTTLSACAHAGVALLIGTTGLPEAVDSALTAAAQAIPVLTASNTSLGVNVLLALVRQAAQALPAGYDIEVVETHHRAKRDAPSGTALALGAAAASGRGGELTQQAVYSRHGVGEARAPQQIGFASIRGGDVVGEHEVWFLGPGERVLLKHSATDRAVFARGALMAGQWLATRKPGRYGMRDVFSSQSS